MQLFLTFKRKLQNGVAFFSEAHNDSLFRYIPPRRMPSLQPVGCSGNSYHESQQQQVYEHCLSTIAMLLAKPLGIFTADDGYLFVTERHTFSDLVDRLASSCICGMSRSPWVLESGCYMCAAQYGQFPKP